MIIYCNDEQWRKFNELLDAELSEEAANKLRALLNNPTIFDGAPEYFASKERMANMTEDEFAQVMDDVGLTRRTCREVRRNSDATDGGW